jgi:glutamyl-Q tRNA(Asp) synthetase
MPETSNHQIATRFAPSPTGLLHLGHAYSALFSAKAAEESGGAFILRMEDIDAGRCREPFYEAIEEDLRWLGLVWQGPVRRQSDHMGDYQKALKTLTDRDLIYPCFCTRKEIQAEIEAAGRAPHGPDGPHYPGTCRALSHGTRNEFMEAGKSFALRLKTDDALKQTGPLVWQDRRRGEIKATPEIFGDVILARKDTPTSYHLAVTVDDHLQGISLVTRGEDLFDATHIHRLLQALLNLPTPTYEHHSLLRGTDGKRFAKRDKSLTLRSLREGGKTAEEVRKMIANYLMN